jgi:Aspartyl protease
MAWNCMLMGCASRCLAVLVAALSAAASLGAAPPGNPAAAVAAAAGHPAHRHLRAETAWSRDGQSGTATLETAGTQRLERECAAGLCGGTWFDGTHLATFGINDTPLPEGGANEAAERTFAAIASTAFAEPEFIAAGGTVATLPAAGGQIRYRVNAPQGSELIAVADARTRRLVQVESADQSLFRRLTASSAGPAIVYGTRDYSRIATVDEPLVAPAGPPLDVTEERDLPLLSASLPVVRCSLSGHAANCLIDTGTTPSSVTLDFAERIGQEPHGQIEIAGLGSYLTGVVDAGPLVLGGATFAKLRLAVIPRAHGAAFDAVLGSDVLEGLRIGFNAGRRQLRVAPPGAAGDGAPIGLTFLRGLPFVSVRLGAREQAEPMLFDTGDSGLISIGYDEYREDMGLFAARGTSTAAGLGALPMDTVEGTLGHVQLGEQPLDSVPISAVRGQHIGHVGYGLSARCADLTVDLGRRRIECRPDAARRRGREGG